MDINLEWDANALAAPQSFRDGVEAAASILDAAILNPITANIEVGYGEFDLNGPGYTPLSSNISLGGIINSIPLSYTELRLALASNETSATDVESVNALPDTASLDGQSSFFISSTLAKAFGVINPSASGIDGEVGFPTSFTGTILINAAITEELHALGLGFGDYPLFSYTAPGIHYFENSATAAYFSLDGGYTDLASYDVGFDPTLFSNQQYDPLNVPDQGVTKLSALDLSEIDAIGFDVTSTPTLPTPSVTTTYTAPGTAPYVTVQNVRAAVDEAIPALSIIKSVSVATGDSIYEYLFYSEGGNGYFVFDGTIEPQGTTFSVLDTELKDLTYFSGSAPGVDDIGVAAADYTAEVDGTWSNALVTTTPAEPAANYNATGRSDVLLQNSNGTIDILTTAASGLAISAAVSDGDPGGSWHVVGTADLNGDGQPDILLQNDNGTIVDYLMNGTGVAATYDLGDAGSAWHVRGTADFSGDGNTDILLQSDSGSMVLWETNGTGIVATSYLGALPAGWAVEGIGDFYGTGQPDILVQSTGGTLVLYTMSGTTITAGAVIANPGPGWSVAGIADYNGDGKADIVLHNDNGSNVLWEMNGATVIGTASFGNPGASYAATVTGLDLNGDGAPDLVVQNTSTSTLIGYTTNDNAAITAGAVLGTPGAGWQAVGDNPTIFIDGTGSTLALTATAGPDQFVLTSFAAGLHTITGFDPAIDTVALSAAAFPSYATVQAHEAPYQGGTFVGLSSTAAVVIQGITPSQLSAANFVLR